MMARRKSAAVIPKDHARDDAVDGGRLESKFYVLAAAWASFRKLVGLSGKQIFFYEIDYVMDDSEEREGFLP